MERYQLYGGGGSPYSHKMRAIFALPTLTLRLDPDYASDSAQPLSITVPPVIPVLRLPEDQSLHVDSTPLALMLEDRHSRRSIIPP